MKDLTLSIIERPILMRPEMARATKLEMKTETRRITGLEKINKDPSSWKLIGEFFHANSNRYGFLFQNPLRPTDVVNVICPYGQVDDLLWIRESWNKDGFGGYRYASDFPDHSSLLWKSSLHMHKAIANTWCQISNVRIERLHDITIDGAKDEGIDIFLNGHLYILPSRTRGVKFTTPCAKDAYIQYINLINKVDKDLNPWVWVISYQVLSTTGRSGIAKGMEVCHA
jgi:hypothetical protein